VFTIVVLVQGQASGRLLAYYTNNGSIHVINKGLWWVHAVAGPWLLQTLQAVVDNYQDLTLVTILSLCT
jgi:hypothetical protein